MSQKDERKQEVTPPEKKTKTEEPLAHLPLPISNLLVCFNGLHKIKKSERVQKQEEQNK